MSQPTTSISDAEWRVMDALWERSPATAAEVIEALDGVADWSPRTIKTLLARLVRKGHLEFVPRGREYVYRPRVGRDACLRKETRSFLGRFFGSSVSPLVAQLIDAGDLSDADVAELEAILEQRRKPGRPGKPRRRS